MTFFLPAAVPARDGNGRILPQASWVFKARDTLTPRATSAGSSITSDANGDFPLAYRTEGLEYRAILNDAAGKIITDIELADESLFAPATQQALASDQLVPGSVWSFYLTGTATPASVYADADLTTPLGFSVESDAAARFPGIYLDSAVIYKAVLTAPDGTTLGTIDPVSYAGMLQYFVTIPGWVGTTARNLTATLDAEEPLTAIPDEVVLEKRRTDFIEFAVYSPLEATGIKWIRHFHSTRLVAGMGAPDYTVGTEALLYATTAVPIFAATGGSGITAASPTSTQAASAATRTGTWVGPTTVTGVANSYYTVTPGDTIEYTISCTAGDVIYSAFPSAFTNGGVVAFTVETGGSEIAAGDYLAPLGGTGGTERVFSTRQDNGTLGVAALFRAPSTASYTITMQLASNSPAGNRLYTQRVDAYAALTGTSAAGAYGSITNSVVIGGTANLTYHPGHTFVISYPASTKINFNYLRNTVCGQVSFKVFDGTGTEVTGLTTTDLDMYGSALNTSVVVMSGKPLDDYKLHVFFKNTKNALSSDYRLYFQTSTAADETTAGVVGTDPFDNQSFPASPSNGGDFGTHVICGPGNHWYSTEWRAPADTSWPPGDDFVGGVHGEETVLTNADIVFKVDGVTVDYDGAAVGDTFTGAEITLEYSTTVNFPGTATAFGTLARKITYRRGGFIQVETVRTVTADATAGEDYILMLQAPNGGNDYSDDVGGGFETFAAERAGNFTLNTSVQTSTPSNPWSEAFACWNTEYANYVQLQNVEEVQAQYEAQLVATGNVLMQDNASHLAKAYLRSAGGSQPTNGVTYASGHVARVVKIYRTIPTANAGDLLA